MPVTLRCGGLIWQLPLSFTPGQGYVVGCETCRANARLNTNRCASAMQTDMSWERGLPWVSIMIDSPTQEPNASHHNGSGRGTQLRTANACPCMRLKDGVKQKANPHRPEIASLRFCQPAEELFPRDVPFTLSKTAKVVVERRRSRLGGKAMSHAD